jgi:type I restriction enzyme S subunit
MEETKLVHKKKVVAPKLRFKEFNDAWQGKLMGDLGHFIGGGTPTTNVEKYWRGNIPWISSSDLIENDIHNINIHKFLTKEAVEESATKIIPKNSVLLISRVGVGKLAINKEEICTSQDFSNFIPITCNSFYIGYFLTARKSLLINFSQGTSIKGFTTSDIKSLKISIPSIREQQKIASFLSTVDEKIQLLNRKKILLEQYKKGVMQQLFSGTLRFKDGNGKAYPKWEKKRMGDVCEIKGRIGYRGYTVQDIVKEGEGAITLSPSNINNGQLNFNNSTYISWFKYEESPEIKVELNDTLLVKTASVGKSAFVSSLSVPATINPQFVILKRTSLYPKYLAYIVYHTTIQKQIKAAIGSGAVPNLSQESISNFILPSPCRDEQKKIADFLSAIDVKLESLSKQISQTQNFKKGLLQQMFV